MIAKALAKAMLRIAQLGRDLGTIWIIVRAVFKGAPKARHAVFGVPQKCSVYCSNVHGRSYDWLAGADGEPHRAQHQLRLSLHPVAASIAASRALSFA